MISVTHSYLEAWLERRNKQTKQYKNESSGNRINLQTLKQYCELPVSFSWGGGGGGGMMWILVVVEGILSMCYQ